MKIRSLGLKVSLIVAVMIVIMVIVVMMVVSTQSKGLIKDLAAHEAASANVSFGKQLENLQKDAMITSNIIASSNDVINAILSGDDGALRVALINIGSDYDVITLCDANGDVLMRTHSDKKGDSVLNQKTILTAINTGQVPAR